jgi:pyruvate dehydrogenase E2 component (dihydrolipoamide acetyltransferase)
MAEIVTMPKLGFDMVEGTLVRWVILEGEDVPKGAILAEIETDKATVEVESVYEGVLIKHLVPEGEIVPVNTPIAVVADADEEVDIQALIDELPTTEEAKEAADAEAPAPVSAPTVKTETTDAAGILPGGVRASPLARRMASDLRIDLRLVQGSGQAGRVTKKDIEAYMAAPAVAAPAAGAPVTAETQPATTPSAVPPLAPAVFEPAPEDTLIPLNRLRAAIGRRMTDVKQSVPHFYVTHEYDMAAVMTLRKQINPMLPEGEKLSVNDFLVKGAALALRQFPNLNATQQGDSILHHGRVNVGVAVAVEGGLLTVVCHDADRKSLRQISVEVRTMAGRAREGKVRPADIEGSTFSVSNLGMFDVEHFIAIINPPEAAILAIGSVSEVPVVVDGEVVPGMRMKATISVDHRVSDGVEAARYMQALAAYLEEPLRLML